MKIAIITQPILQNYGGAIQNFALQHVLNNKFKYDAETIDCPRIPISRFYVFVLSWLKTIALLLTKRKKRHLRKYTHIGCRSEWMRAFVASYIKKTSQWKRLTINKFRQKDYDVVVVGSDQVWRPKFVYSIYDYFLLFLKNENVTRIAYAVSFGTDEWEYTLKQTKVCSELARKFKAISVREQSGVNLCKEYLGVDASWVLDPTLLLTKEDYMPICEEVPVCAEKYLAAYVLDENENVTTAYEKEAAARGLVVKKFYADSKSALTVPEWLAMFRDASYVVTDSFHGTVFSIIFGKEFKCVYNEFRGSARFESLLKLYNSGQLDEMRKYSLDWLKNALEK